VNNPLDRISNGRTPQKLSNGLSNGPVSTPAGKPRTSEAARASASVMLSAVADRVDARVRLLMTSELARWTEIDAQLAEPIDALSALVLAGGKRLRPAFAHWAFVGTGGDPEDTRIVDAGAGLELLHTFALVHDDIMDGSSTRRGMEAVHVQFVRAHRNFKGRGEDRRFGEGAAILVGDLAFVYADVMMATLNAEAIAVFNELRIEVNIGQYLDLVGSVRGEPTLEAAQRICQYKSGKYTIERPLHLGAALADQLSSFEPALSAYGMPLGEAFQLRDDIMGAVGDDAITGKPVGDDLREGKPTALVARAREVATIGQRELLSRIGDPKLSDSDIGELQQVLVATGSVTWIEDRVSQLRDQALTAIQTSGLTNGATEALVDLAYYVTDRAH
jgi:geranylgeranyl diphosphate synthase, type I